MSGVLTWIDECHFLPFYNKYAALLKKLTVQYWRMHNHFLKVKKTCSSALWHGLEL